jgi:hypothetical protein
VVDEPGTRSAAEVMWASCRLGRNEAAAAISTAHRRRSTHAHGSHDRCAACEAARIADECVPRGSMENAARGILKAAPPRRLRFRCRSLNPGAARDRRQARKEGREARGRGTIRALRDSRIWVEYDGNALAVPPSDPASIRRSEDADRRN